MSHYRLPALQMIIVLLISMAPAKAAPPVFEIEIRNRWVILNIIRVIVCVYLICKCFYALFCIRRIHVVNLRLLSFHHAVTPL